MSGGLPLRASIRTRFLFHTQPSKGVRSFGLRSSSESRLILHAFLKGVAEAALYCAHRTIYMLSPSLLVMSLGMGTD